MSAVPRFDHVPVPWGEVWNWAEATPEPASAEFAETATLVPLTNAFAAGAVIDPVGAVLSMRTLAIVGEIEVLPTLSVATTRTS